VCGHEVTELLDESVVFFTLKTRVAPTQVEFVVSLCASARGRVSPSRMWKLCVRINGTYNLSSLLVPTSSTTGKMR
jgi:hypothetical protein